MSNAKRKTFIAVQAIIVVMFVIAAIIGMGAFNVKADDVQINGVSSQTDKEVIDSLTVNGNVPSDYDPKTKYAGQEVALLTTGGDIQNFLQGNMSAKVGYIVNDIQFSWNGAMTNVAMADNLIFDGNGKKITLTASSLNSSPGLSRDKLGNSGQNTFIYAGDRQSNEIDVNGAFIGYVPATSKIINTKFEFKNKIEGTQSTQSSGCGGFVAGYCNGVIDNCSINVTSNAYFKITKTNSGRDTQQAATNGYAFGGLVGMLAGTNAIVSNSSVNLESDSLLYVCVDPTNTKDNSPLHNYSNGRGRAFLGGIAGWMGDSSNAYNLVTSGSGTIQTTFTGKIENALGQVGIAVGSCTSTTDPSGQSSISGTSSPGHINGVINSWTGQAKYYFDAGQYSPQGDTGDSYVYGMLVGMSGDQGSQAETVSNFYSVGDKYTGSNWYSIGHSYQVKGGTKDKAPSKMSNVIDVKYRQDADGSLHTAPANRAKVIWGGTNNTSDVYVVYDISADNDHILWAKEVTKKTSDGAVGENFKETYYWQNDSLEDAKKFDVTYTALKRGLYPKVEVDYEFGRAVYIRKIFDDGKIAQGSADTIRDSIEYGTKLDIPKIELYTQPNTTASNALVRTIPSSDYSYWKTLKGSSKNPDPANGYKEIGDYTTFLYLDNPTSSTINYNNIHLLDENYRLVAYIKDDANYQKFAQEYKANTGRDYSHIDAAGFKTFDWQPRIKQTVEPKSVSLNIQEPAGSFQYVDDMTTTEYQGGSIVYSAAVPSDELVGDDAAVTATLEYYEADDNFVQGNKIDAASDVGNYIVHPSELSNPNYRIADSVEDVKLNIRKRTTVVQMNENLVYTPNGSTCLINLDYNGDEQIINYGSGKGSITKEEMERNNYAFFFYNVEEADLQMIQIDIMGMEGQGSSYNAIDVPEEGAEGSYQVIISFADGDASANYNLPATTRFVIKIVPVEIDFENPNSLKKDFIYGDKTPESDGYYAYGVAKDGVTKIEPTSAEYSVWDNEIGGYVPCDPNPRNVGTYKIIYTISNESERNYLTTSQEYIISINKRSVTFRTTPDQVDQYTFGSPYTPGSGTFGLFNSTDNIGLSTTHGYYHKVAYRYQYIGEPIGEMDTLPDGWEENKYTDMTKIYDELLEEIWDVGLYIVYPVLLLPCSDPSHNHAPGEVPYVYDEEQAANYEFNLNTTHVSVHKLEVRIELKDVKKEYSKPVAEFVGAADADDAQRSWKYATGSPIFRVRDEIVVNLVTNATAESEVGSINRISVGSIQGKQGVAGIGGVNDDLDKSNNYKVVVVNPNQESALEVVKLTINIRTFTDVRSVIYGDALPRFTFDYADGSNHFMSGDEMLHDYVYSSNGVVIDGNPKNVGTYEVGIDFSRSEKYGNYNINVSGVAVFTITAREIKIDEFSVDNATRVYNGQVQYPNTTITFKNILEEDKENVTVAFNFFDEDGNIVNNPINVGVYTARVDENQILNKDDMTLNTNYVLVMNEGNTEYKSATVEITPLNVKVKVNNATRVYQIPGSLKAIKNSSNWDNIEYIDEGELPYIVESGRFIPTDKIGYELYIEQFFDELTVHEGVVQIRFSGEAIDAGNYNITFVNGNLLVIDANFDEIEDYLFVTYDGNRIGVDIDEKAVVYTGENLFGKFNLYTHNDAIKDKIAFAFTDAEGNDVNGVIVNAGTYRMVITPNGNDSPFQGEKTLEFVVNKAVRNITAADIKMEVHYNKLVFSSDIPALQYSINTAINSDGSDSAFISAESDNTFVYTNVRPSNNYFIRIRVEDGIDPNYEDSNILEIFVSTGIDASDLASRINALQTITFSNMTIYSNLKEQINSVHKDDMYLIDMNKIAALDASLAKLYSDAAAAVSGAQNVTAKAVGKSNNSSAATALALSSTGIGLGAVGLMVGMIAMKKKKEDEVQVEESAKVQKTTGKKYAKLFVVSISILLIAVLALAGCKTTTMKQEELLELASYKKASNEKSRNYEVTVSYGSTIVYHNENGTVKTLLEGVDAPEFALGADGSGLDFNESYFKNISYVTSRTTASFTADVSNVEAFLGRANATNARVVAVADIENERLQSIEITYNEGEFRVKISTSLEY